MIKSNRLAMFMVLVMGASLLSGCGNSEGKNEENGSSGASVTDEAMETTEADSIDSGNEDIAEITMIYPSWTSIPKGLADVEAAINDITEEEINVHVNINMIESGSYDQQIGLMMSSGENVDLMLTMPIGSSAYNNMANQKQLMDISSMLSAYGEGILDTVGHLIDATTVVDCIYAVPTYRSLVTSAYIVMRTDVLEDLGLLEKAENMTSFTEYEEILEAVKNSDKWSYLAGIVNSDADGLCLPVAGFYLGVDQFSDAGAYDLMTNWGI